ncbi:hypothetical protein [Cyanobium gracile]|uniref:DUF433 domain-containing protein n=1 Tax=Cyanobium gracile UHCC 0281 TaxID=3110309 RepID=A0ABU5SV20_9CYAN|nr:hypothetical protein [Cyanobium gracile]MEA5442371.1 hypothetical protein [Cyanobium gracile UHCC 0281]
MSSVPGVNPLRCVIRSSSRERIFQSYPQIEEADIDESLAYTAWRMEEREEALVLN